MLGLLIVIVRALALVLCGQQELVLENLALRQQLMAIKRATRRRHLQGRDRLFWIALRRIWKNLEVDGRPRATRHCRAMASRLVPPAVDPTVDTPSEWPSTRHSGDPRPRP